MKSLVETLWTLRCFDPTAESPGILEVLFFSCAWTGRTRSTFDFPITPNGFQGEMSFHLPTSDTATRTMKRMGSSISNASFRNSSEAVLRSSD